MGDIIAAVLEFIAESLRLRATRLAVLLELSAFVSVLDIEARAQER